MKKAISALLAIVAVTALFAGMVQNPDGSCAFWWTLSCLVLCAGAVLAWKKLNPEEAE